jgi:hypothetical protein
MAKVIPLPTRGQPLDVSFIYDLAEGVNSLTAGLASQKGSVNVKGQTDKSTNSAKTVNSTIFATYVNAVENATIQQGQIVALKPIDFNYGFSTPPIVIATPVADKNSLVVGQSATVVLTDVTTSQAKLSVRFAESGNAVTLGVNVLIIGIPSL